jgi:predicted DNA-binding protein with PD1-like motif
VSAIGSVRGVQFSDIQAGARLPITEPRMPVHLVEGPLDLLGLEGNLVPNETGKVDPHLHIFGAKSSGEVVGGHLIEAEVFATCEIILSEYIVEGVERQHSTRGGVDTLFFEDAEMDRRLCLRRSLLYVPGNMPGCPEHPGVQRRRRDRPR